MSGGIPVRVFVCVCFIPKEVLQQRLRYDYGCVQLASLRRPRGAHSGEPLTRANQTITHPLVVTSCTSGQPQVTRSTSRALEADPGEPLE